MVDTSLRARNVMLATTTKTGKPAHRAIHEEIQRQLERPSLPVRHRTLRLDGGAPRDARVRLAKQVELWLPAVMHSEHPALLVDNAS